MKSEIKISDVIRIILEGYKETPKKWFLTKKKKKEIILYREWCVGDFLMILKDVENGFKGTYNEWLELEYDSNLLPILK